MIISLNNLYASKNKLVDDSRKYGLSFRLIKVLTEPLQINQIQEDDFIDEDD